MKVVVVESPAKAKTINKYLGRDYEVLASFGHIRDLPAKDGSVDPEQDFHMVWELDDRGAKRVSEIAKAVKGADKLILATDPDREGEAISWHVLEALTARKAPQGHPGRARHLQRHHQGLGRGGDAQAPPDRPGPGRRLPGAPGARLPRRLQPLAGAVAQAPGRPLGRPRPVGGPAPRLRARDGDRDASSRANTGRSSRRWPPRTARPSRPASSEPTASGSSASMSATARRPPRSSATSSSRPSRWRASRRSPPSATRSRPSPPRPCSRKPRASSAWRRRRPCGSRSASTRASTSAARRSASSPTCGPTASTWRRRRSRTPAGSSARSSATATCPDVPRKYSVKAKNAQEAHEAVRPTDMGRLPKTVARHLEPEQAKLYDLIWTRTIASQMESAELERTTVDVAASGRPAPDRPARHRPGREVRRLPDPLPGGQGRRGGRGEQAACRR